MYDIIVIGAGIAGLTASIYGARANKKVLVLDDKGFGGQIINSYSVENYPGFKSISGFELMKNIYDQAISFGVSVKNESVIKIDEHNVYTNNNVYNTRTIIIANGLVQRKLGLQEETKFVGKGLSYCATCDGNFFKGKDVAVVGGGYSALDDALYLSKIANKVYLIHRTNKFRFDQSILDGKNIELITNCNVTSINGDDYVSSISLSNGTNLSVNALFVAIGLEPKNEIFKDVIELDSEGFINSNNTLTNVENIFVAGDTRNKDFRQLITAASDGAIAASNAIRYLNY